MHLDLRHLRTIRAIHQHGGLGRAAEALHITQSALSHQLKGLEAQAGVEVVVRRSKPLRLSAAGMRLLRTAEQVLPLIAAAEAEFRALEAGRAGRLHIALECHACFSWLLPVLDRFRRSWPDVDVDIRPGLAFAALTALLREQADVVISSDPEVMPGIVFEHLFDYEPRLVVSRDHPLARCDLVTPHDLADQTLLTYPMDRARLDVFTDFLDPAGVQPLAVRQVEMTPVILMLVAAGRGVAVLPDWVLRETGLSPEVVDRPLGQGIRRRLYAALREADQGQPWMAQFLSLVRADAGRQLRR